MHRSSFVLSFACLALTGCTLITDGVIEDQVNCQGLDDGTVCGNEIDDDLERICWSGTCVEKKCGDGFVDTANGEDCDDRNGIAGDGCAPVSCLFECDEDLDCDDGLVCTGIESCDVTTHACVAGTSVVCTASDACHAIECDEETGACAAETRLDDADGDGHSSLALRPTCGDDCNDNDPEIFPGNIEECGDGKDNNCASGTSDEQPLNWYADCDQDSYSVAGSPPVNGCMMPDTDNTVTGCPNDNGSWTTRNPNNGVTSRDCAPLVAEAHPDDPNVSFDNVTFHEGTVPGSMPANYDWDCDTLNEASPSKSNLSSCSTPCIPGRICETVSCYDGWVNATPGCGAVNQQFRDGSCNAKPCTICTCTLTTRDQTCR